MNGVVHPSILAATQIAQWPALVDGLADALASEKRLIDELVLTMRKQRDAVAADDLQAIDDSVFAVQRILLTLGEARKRRRTLNQRLGQSEDVPLRELLEALGPHATDELREAREALIDSARVLARDVAINRRILAEALADGEKLVRAIAGAATPVATVGYGQARTHEGSAPPLIINRKA
ncbi:MAG: flagellar export chaperone FlgN [Gemmatimonadota bacterium]